MKNIGRRSFLGGAAGSLLAVGTSGTGGLFQAAHAHSRHKSRRKSALVRPHVLIIGGGAAGTSVARSIAVQGKGDVKVTLVENRENYQSCFLSNHYLGGFRSLDSLTYSYDILKALGVHRVRKLALRIEPDRRKVICDDDDALTYDILVLAPGVAFRYETIEGLSDNASVNEELHAWGHGGQVQKLRHDVLNMQDGDSILVSAPLGPCKGRAFVYERVSMLAHFIKYQRPASKIIFLDPWSGDDMGKLFESEWQKHYPGLIERIHGAGDATVNRVNLDEGKVFVASGDVYKADILNIIPEQRAGDLVFSAGLTKGFWCPVDAGHFRSALDKSIYILGDAAIGDSMPKTASAAFSQAEIVSQSILATWGKGKVFAPRYRSVVWPLVSTNNALKFGGTYIRGKHGLKQTGTFHSIDRENGAIRAAQYRESLKWFGQARENMFGSA